MKEIDHNNENIINIWNKGNNQTNNEPTWQENIN